MQPRSLFQVGAIALKPAQAGIGVSDSGGNRLIHFVRQEAVSSPMVVTGWRARGPPALTQRLFGLLALNGDTRKMGDSAL